MAQLKVTAVPFAQDANIKFPAKDYPADKNAQFVGKAKIAAVKETSSGGGNLQSKSKSYTPTESAVSETISPDPGYDALSQVDVSVGAISSTYVGSGVTQRTSSDLSASGATVTAPAGYYSSNATKTVASGSATPAASISATGATYQMGDNTFKLSKTVSNTPQVSAGYISSGTSGNTAIELTTSVPVLMAEWYHPSTVDQTIPYVTVLRGTQTFKAVTLTNLTPANILSGVTVKVGDDSDDDCVASVTGTATASSYTLKGTTTLTVSTTSTTAATAGSLECGSGTFERSKIVYVRVRDKAGPRAGYFYGSDAWFINYQDANGSTSTLTAAGRQGLWYNSSNQWATASSSYGVYGYSITSGGKVTIRRRYNSSYGTINGDFLVQVYMLDYPDGHSPFNTGVIT